MDISSLTKRSKLKPKREPYWSRIGPSQAIGYRKMTEGEGTWIARGPGDVKYSYKPLGQIDREGKRDPFDIAVDRARDWFKQLDAGVSMRGETVADAARLYVIDRGIAKGKAAAADATGRFNRLVYGKSIGKIPLQSLREKHFTAWRNAQLPDIDTVGVEELRKAKDSINRNVTGLKAALNFARRSKLIASDDAWRDIKPFAAVRRRRTAFLSMAQRRALLKAAPSDLRAFCSAALLTGARAGELAAANVNDFDKQQGLLTLGGKTGRRTVSLSSAAVAVFAQAAKDRIAAAPLLARSDGVRWDRFYWRDKFRAAADKAKLPSNVVLYTLRHVAITEFIQSGIDPSTVAKLAGTSTRMIDEHYGHLAGERTRARLDLVRVI